MIAFLQIDIGYNGEAGSDWLDRADVRGLILSSLLLAGLAAPAATAEPPAVTLWNDPRDYPPDALLRGQEGDVGLVLSLTAEGEIESCSITESSENRSLDAASCALLTARKWFPPATERRGSGPVRQQVLIRWKIRPVARGLIDYGGAWPIEPQSWVRQSRYPKAARRARREGRVQIAYDITDRGRVGSCTILDSSGSPELDAATCRLYLDHARFVPAGGAGGGPRPTRATSFLVWRLAEAPSEPRP